MTNALKVAVDNEINSLRQRVGVLTSGIQTNKLELNRYERALKILVSRSPRSQQVPLAKTRANKGRVDWDQVLAKLPVRFTPSKVVEVSRHSIGDSGQALLRWMSNKKITRLKRGVYMKTEAVGRRPHR